MYDCYSPRNTPKAPGTWNLALPAGYVLKRDSQNKHFSEQSISGFVHRSTVSSERSEDSLASNE